MFSLPEKFIMMYLFFSPRSYANLPTKTITRQPTAVPTAAAILVFAFAGAIFTLMKIKIITATFTIA